MTLPTSQLVFLAARKRVLTVFSCAPQLAEGELENFDELNEWRAPKGQVPQTPSPPDSLPDADWMNETSAGIPIIGKRMMPPLPNAADQSITEIPITHLLNGKLRTLFKSLRRKNTTRPRFRSLPSSMHWPNLEVTFFVSFSTGLLQCASAVLGCSVEGYATTRRSLAISITVICLVGFTYAYQAVQMLVFLRYHNEACWTPADKPESKDQLEDPLMALLTNVSRGRIPPIARENGSFEPPEEDTEEPGCTERSLHRAFSWRIHDPRKMRPGDALTILGTWLGDGVGSSRGIWYLFGMIALQLTTAIVLGITYAMQWSQSNEGSKTLLGFLICLQLLGAYWSGPMFGPSTANDKIDGAEKFVVYLCEACSTTLMLAGSFVADASNGGENLDALSLSLQLSGLSAQILMVAIFFPMSITVYNSFVVPIVGILWSGEGNKREMLCQMLMTCILLPYSIATSFLGCGGVGAVADVVGELEGSMVELAAETEGEAEEAPAAEDQEGKEEGAADAGGEAVDAAADPSKQGIAPIAAAPAAASASDLSPSRVQ